MNLSQEILSDICVYNKYSKFRADLGRRETWTELVQRNKEMHLRKFPDLKSEIEEVYNNYVLPKKILPSMRSLQFGGTPIEISNTRIFNCSYLPIDHPVAFAETMFLLLSGAGVGYSVQSRHIEKLPVISGPMDKKRRFLIGDSIEGWADSIKVLIKAYTQGKSDPAFDFRDIRPKGAQLITSGGKAPGPDPLRICLDQLRKVLNGSIGRKLKSIEVHDMLCHIADAVLAGGIRRAAMIAGFDKNDEEMLACKTGSWRELNPQRGRANNSAILERGNTTKDEFLSIWKRVELSGSGEPGFYWSNNLDWFCNPCVEIALRPFQFCNLCEVNVSDIVDQKDLNERVSAAAFIGTLQASYTDFHYLRNIWKETTEKDALIGVSMTGIASGKLDNLNLAEAAMVVIKTNQIIASLIGINAAARTTCGKPAGSTSLVFGTSSGIHAWHNDFYIRRMRVGKNEALYHYMKAQIPDLIEDDIFKPSLEAVMSFPQRAPVGSIYRNESTQNMLSRISKFNKEWVAPGHLNGDNKHNMSVTVSVKKDEWDFVGEWMFNNSDSYTGISVLPHFGDDHGYKQLPFEDCTEETYLEMEKLLHSIDLSQVKEVSDNTALNDQAACGGGICEITF